MTRILGIDPGSRFTGYGVLELRRNQVLHVAHGCIRSVDDLPAERLRRIFEEIDRVIDSHNPQEAAVERVFMHKNADSALKLGQARGVAIAACAVRGLEVFEYAANRVKQAIVGKGHADKAQVQYMVKVLLRLRDELQEDASDALAVALCHGHSRDSAARLAAQH